MGLIEWVFSLVNWQIGAYFSNNVQVAGRSCLYTCVLFCSQRGGRGMADPIATRPPGPDSSWDQTGNDIIPLDPLPPGNGIGPDRKWHHTLQNVGPEKKWHHTPEPQKRALYIQLEWFLVNCLELHQVKPSSSPMKDRCDRYKTMRITKTFLNTDEQQEVRPDQDTADQ